ncbi:hypothetical protein CVT24_010866 [Panaeolus cyanescens]|uniref:Uncharacterized protein n=1 Tax=Panaeolus cyanescens TaxID=181874 RepID=A0A409YVH2_9AGAR|nr:hypothetical protein CVT24_010866 [Panaeolus cyanescens]
MDTTALSSLTSRIDVSLRSQVLKALPVMQKRSVLKMSDIVNEGVAIGLVGLMSGVVGGVGDVVGMRGRCWRGGGIGEERENADVERERDVEEKERVTDGTSSRLSPPSKLPQPLSTSGTSTHHKTALLPLPPMPATSFSTPVKHTRSTKSNS